jgi:hypothetical protein
VFVPSSGLGPPTPSPASECVSPLGPKGGRSNTPWRVRGWGNPIRKNVNKAWHSVYSVLLRVLIHQTVAFHSSFLLSFSPHTSESLLTLLRFTPGTAALHSSHDCSSSSRDCIHSPLCFPSLLTPLILFLTVFRFTSDTAVLHSSHD